MKHKRGLLSIAMASIMLVSLCAVVSTTGVSAAPSSANVTTSKPASTSVSAPQISSANVQSGLVGAPAGIVGAPAVCSQSPFTHTYDLFIRGTDNALWWKHWDGATWSAWTFLGGYITSSPGATSYSPGYTGSVVYVAARGGDGALWTRKTTNAGATWSAWESKGGQLLPGTGPAIVSPDSDIVRYFVTGTNHQLYFGNGSSWRSLGGYVTSSPSAEVTSMGPTGSLVVAVRGGDGACWLRSTQVGGTTWYNWESIGGQILEGTGPGVVLTFGTFAHFVTGTNHQLYWLRHNSGWENLGGYLTSSPSAASRIDNEFVFFAVGSDGDIWSRNTTNAGASWSPWYEAISL